MRRYLEETGVPVFHDDKSLQDALNESMSDKPPEEKTYSNDPEYSEVSEEIFSYFKEVK